MQAGCLPNPAAPQARRPFPIREGDLGVRFVLRPEEIYAQQERWDSLLKIAPPTVRRSSVALMSISLVYQAR